MEETIKKEIEKCELADAFIDAFLSPQHAALGFIGALQKRQVPNVADLFNSEQIEAAAAITKTVSALINLQLFAPICAFRLLRTSSAKRKRSASPKSKSANASFNLRSTVTSSLSHMATNEQIILLLKVGDELRQAKVCVEVFLCQKLLIARRLVAGTPQKSELIGF